MHGASALRIVTQSTDGCDWGASAPQVPPAKDVFARFWNSIRKAGN